MTIGKNCYESAKVMIKVYDGCKYDAASKKVNLLCGKWESFCSLMGNKRDPIQ